MRFISSHVRFALSRSTRPVSFDRGLSWKVRDLARWYPTSREKRARCGAPGILVRTDARGSWLVTSLLWGGAPDHLDEVVEAEVAGEGGFDLAGVELVVLLGRYDGLVQWQTDDGPAEQTLCYSLFA
jgi:hypothetical protein